MKVQLKEKEFEQKFDIIGVRKRLVLDIEKDKYPEDTITFYLNGTTGDFSMSKEDVIRENVPHHEKDFDEWKSHQRGRKYLTAQYDEEQELVFFHMIEAYVSEHKKFRQGSKIGYREFGRFSVGKNLCVNIREGSPTADGRSSRPYIDTERYINKMLSHKGEYRRSHGKEALPFSTHAFQYIFGTHENYMDYESGNIDTGLAKVIKNIYPAVFNISGNKHMAITNYDSLYTYFSTMNNGLSCCKKTGKKQDYIDKMVALKMPEDESDKIDEKYAIIQKVEGAAEPTCCVRMFNYYKSEDISFEGGRIYVTKKTAEFCKVNNNGDWVHQPFPQKINNWDFCVNDFNEEETKGTMLEYFGKILDDIEIYNRAIAIFLFIKFPLVEAIAKLAGGDFTDKMIESMEEMNDVEMVITNGLGIKDKNCKKIFQALGMNKFQFEEIKPILAEGMPTPFFNISTEKYVMPLGMIPFMKKLLGGQYADDISSIDIETFKRYLDFASDIYSIYGMFEKTPKKDLNTMVYDILEMASYVKTIFPTFNIEKLFPIFAAFMAKAGQKGYDHGGYENRVPEVGWLKDYTRMASYMENPLLYKPEFSSLEDLKLMHDNISLLVKVSSDQRTTSAFKMRNHIWQPWEFRQDEKKAKDGTIKQEALPFIVVAPKEPSELATEGTVLHHCVKHYIERVAKGETNIMFIRKREEPDTPFFTVEVTNDGVIEQVHGFSNRNANTEEGLTNFVQLWARKKRLKTHTYNKVR